MGWRLPYRPIPDKRIGRQISTAAALFKPAKRLSATIPDHPDNRAQPERIGMASNSDPLQKRYRQLTSEASYERWHASLDRSQGYPDPDPYLCDHGVVGGFYVNPAAGRPPCSFCRALPEMTWRQVHLDSPLPGQIRRRAKSA